MPLFFYLDAALEIFSEIIDCFFILQQVTSFLNLIFNNKIIPLVIRYNSSLFTTQISAFIKIVLFLYSCNKTK